MEHEKYMRRTIEITNRNPATPFGCVIVDRETGEILAEGLNDDEKNPILHGETVAIMNLVETYPAIERSRLVLYTAAEPCPMCSGAILWSGIRQVVLGASIQYLKKLGLPQIDLPCEEVSRRCSCGGFEVTRGVLESECEGLFTEPARLGEWFPKGGDE